MSVNEAISAYSTAAASNTPAGTDPIGTNLDDHIRDVKKNIRILSNELSAFESQQFFPADPSLFLSAGTSVSAGEGLTVINTFTLGLAQAPEISATYEGVFLANTIDKFGRTLEFTAASSLEASQTDVFSARRTDVFVTPDAMAAHQGMVRAYGTFDGSGTASTFLSYNIDSIIRSAAGTYLVDFSSIPLTGTHFVANITAEPSPAGTSLLLGSADRTTTSYRFTLVNTGGTKTDSTLVSVAIFGRLAAFV